MEAKVASSVSSAGEGKLLALVIWMIPLVVIVVGARRWLPELASEHGAGIDVMLQYLFVTVGGLLAIGHIAFGYFLWRFSGKPNVTHRLSSPKAERRWSLIPIVLMTVVAEGGVFVLGMPVWAKFYAAAAPPEAITVEVTAEQFAWNVRYSGQDGVFGKTAHELLSLNNPLGLDEEDAAAQDDVLILNELFLPVNHPARIRLRSKDVIHSFFLPSHRVKQDAVPGMTIDLWFVPTEVGTFEIACTELCGFGHYQMRGLLKVLPQAEFEQLIRDEPSFF